MSVQYNNSMSRHPDVLIIGGGVIGLTTAYFLARERLMVTVVDQGEPGQESSWAGAGIIPSGNPKTARTPFDQLRAHSTALFPSLSAELGEKTGIDNGYLRCGGLEFADPEHPAAEEEWRGEGVACKELSQHDARALEPALAPGLGPAYYLPDMAQVRNPQHVKALVAGCQALGVRFASGCPVLRLEVQKGRVSSVHTSAGPVEAGKYLLAAGAWSEALLRDVGWQPGVAPVRGQIVLLQPAAPLIRRVLMRGPRYLVPRPDGRVLAGSTEESVGFCKQTTATAVSSLIGFGLALVPALAEARLERAWAGLRPGSPDGLPFLGAVPGHDNCYVATGHFRAGIQLSPGTALVMKELMLGQRPTVSLDAFRLDRPTVPFRA